MTTTIAIPLFEGFTALDAVGPYEVLVRLPDSRVTFVAAEAGPVTADTGALTLVADAAFADVPSSDVPTPDVIVVPGGPGTRRMLEPNPLLDWLRATAPAATWVTSVCTGSLLLAAAGLLDGVDATTHWLWTDVLAALGANPVDERVVVRGNVVTAAGVSAGIDMALTLAAQLAGDDVARRIQLGIEYDPQPPFDAGSPRTAPPALVDGFRAARR